MGGDRRGREGTGGWLGWWLSQGSQGGAPGTWQMCSSGDQTRWGEEQGRKGTGPLSVTPGAGSGGDAPLRSHQRVWGWATLSASRPSKAPSSSAGPWASPDLWLQGSRGTQKQVENRWTAGSGGHLCPGTGSELCPLQDWDPDPHLARGQEDGAALRSAGTLRPGPGPSSSEAPWDREGSAQGTSGTSHLAWMSLP